MKDWPCKSFACSCEKSQQVRLGVHHGNVNHPHPIANAREGLWASILISLPLNRPLKKILSLVMVLTSLSHVLLHGKRHPWFMFSSVIVLFHCHTFLIFVLRSFQICCMCFFLIFLIFKYLDWCSPFFFLILKFICCQFAACLFFGISLIKYFLFSPLSPWLLTLLPTLTIVCCGKFLLVDLFCFVLFCFLLPSSPPHPLFIFCFSLWKSQFHCSNKLCQQQGTPHVSQEKQHCQL